MNILIDIMGSTFIGGMVFLLIFKLNIYGSNQRFSSDSELQLQQNAKTQAEILNYDLRKVGFECDSTAIAIADSERIQFYSDIDRDGSIDVVTYYVNRDPKLTSGTTNPHDIILCRVVNSDTLIGPSLGLTRIKFSYLDQKSVATTVLGNIKFIRAELWLETSEPVETMFTSPQNPYPFTYWEMTINPRNI
ncbi:MAG TPA: hypothetical protein VF270_06240 [Ignavibacteriaceae bacterium]